MIIKTRRWRHGSLEFALVADDLAVVGEAAGGNHHHLAAQFGKVTQRIGHCVCQPRAVLLLARSATLSATNVHPKAMRLTVEQANTIRRIASEEAGVDVDVRLFGSRLDDTARGGDVDLLVQTSRLIDNPALFSARLSARLMRALGGRRVDVLLSAPNLETLPIHAFAAAEGVRL